MTLLKPVGRTSVQKFEELLDHLFVKFLSKLDPGGDAGVVSELHLCLLWVYRGVLAISVTYTPDLNVTRPVFARPPSVARR